MFSRDLLCSCDHVVVLVYDQFFSVFVTKCRAIFADIQFYKITFYQITSFYIIYLGTCKFLRFQTIFLFWMSFSFVPSPHFILTNHPHFSAMEKSVQQPLINTLYCWINFSEPCFNALQIYYPIYNTLTFTSYKSYSLILYGRTVCE